LPVKRSFISFIGKTLEEVRNIAEMLPAGVVRFKGFVEENGQVYIFNFVMGDWTIEKTDLPKKRLNTRILLFYCFYWSTGLHGHHCKGNEDRKLDKSRCLSTVQLRIKSRFASSTISLL